MVETQESLAKRGRITNTDYDRNSKIDRLSSLPDFLLVDILSSLRLDAAARTSVLSHRWRYVWTYRTCLHLDEHLLECPCDICKDFHNFYTNADHIIKQLKSPKIQSLLLACPSPSTDNEKEQCTSYLGSWISLICRRNPEVIKVMFSNFEGHINMPMCIFHCPSLVSLILSGRFHCKLPYINGLSISLPNLKELALKYINMDLKHMGTLINSCPVLENLALSLKLSEDELVDISAKNLKFLGIEIYGTSRRCKFIIDAPNLQDINVSGRLVSYQFVSQLSVLQWATIGIWNSAFRSEDYYRSKISEFLSGLGNVRVLNILDNLAIFNPVNHLRPDVFQTFCNLTQLHLTYVSTHLVNWSAPVPVCLLCRLKCIEMIEVKGVSKDLKLVKYILRHATVLEMLNIEIFHRDGSDEHNIWREYKFCDALFELQRSSSSCEINFKGLYMTASSSGYQDGSLSCQINYTFLRENELELTSESDSTE